MSRNDVLNEIKEILLGDEFTVVKEVAENITENTSIINDMAFDSLQVLNLIVLIEGKFGFVCDEEELNLDLFNNISQLIDFIMKKQGEK